MARKSSTEDSGFNLFDLLNEIETENLTKTQPAPVPASVRSAENARTGNGSGDFALSANALPTEAEPPSDVPYSADRIRALLAENAVIEAAKQVATFGHDGVFRRDGQPYISHPAAIAARATNLALPVDAIAVAWLHDVVEDTEFALTDLTDLGFPPSIVAGVDAMSRRFGPEYPDGKEPYFDLVRRSAADPIGQLIKALDNEDNGRGDQPATPDHYRDSIRRDRKYLKARTILAEATYGARSHTPDLNSEAALPHPVTDPVPHPTPAELHNIQDRISQQRQTASATIFLNQTPPEVIDETAPSIAVEQVPPVDYQLPPGITVPASPRDRVRANIDAITVLQQLDRAQQPATTDQQTVLAGWSGWGAAPHMFDAPHALVGAWWQNVYDRQIPRNLGTSLTALTETGNTFPGLGQDIQSLRQLTDPTAVSVQADLIRQNLKSIKPALTAPDFTAWRTLDNAVAAVSTAASWQPLREELAALIDADTWSAANHSTVNAHYTDPAVVRQIWSAVNQLGGPGPRILEPGCGSGTFIGHADNPAQMIGVELDEMTAKVAATLYPSATIHAEGFHADGWQAESVTAVVGNVPFGNYKLYDAEYNGGGHSIHNHFIIKSLALTAPGGLVAVVTSSHTMDAGPTARREMHTYGDLLGAIRLPSGAFKEVAGTDVVCDILIFRRRTAQESPLPLSQWETAIPVPTTDGEVLINTYFANNPDRILGRMELGTGQHGKTELKVIADTAWPLEDQLADQISAITRNAHRLGMTYAVDASLRLPEPKIAGTRSWSTTGRPGTIRPIGTKFERLSPFSHTWEPFQIKANKDQIAGTGEEMRHLLQLRDLAEALIEQQATGTDPETVTATREGLADLYRRYNTAYGPINRYTPTTRTAWINVDNLDESEIDPEWEQRTRPGKRPKGADNSFEPDPITQVHRETIDHQRPPAIVNLRSDPGFATVLALELFDDETMTSTPAPILSENILTRREAPTTAASAAEALAISIAETGGVDLMRIAGLLEDGTSPAIARQRLGDQVYDDPATDELVPAGLYLAGDTRNKLDIARHAATLDDRYQPNIHALQEVIPPDVTPGDIDARPGVTWIPGTDYQQFIKEVLDIEDTTVTWSPITGRWDVQAPGGGARRSVAAERTWGTKDRNGLDLLTSLMTNTPVTVMKTVYDSEGRERQVPDEVATEVANDKRDQIAAKFNSWIWENPERNDRLLHTYNRTFNSYVAATYDGSGLSLPGLGNQFNPRPTQKNAVARILTEPTVLLDHVVGAGKTGTMITAAMELRRMGKARQPWIVVPNHIVVQVAREAKQWYPNASILAGGSKTDNIGRREFAALTATGDYDMVIVPESLFVRLPVSPGTQTQYISERLNKLEDSIRFAKAADGKESSSKELAKAKSNLEAKLLALRADGKAGKDLGVQFEQTGCDYLFIDEAHLYKNKMVASGTSDLARATEPQRVTDLDLKLNFLRDSKPGQPITTFATGTPIPNSPREMWVMMDYLAPDLLEKAGMDTFDAWAANHLRPQTRLEMKPTGSGFAPKTRITAFTNVPELTRMWRQMSDHVTRDDLNTALPVLAGGARAGRSRPRTPEQAHYAGVLEARAAAAKGKRPAKGEDNMLSIAGDGRKAALDQRLVGLPTPADNGRAAQVRAEIMRVHEYTQHRTYRDERGEIQPRTGALQLVFCDQSTPKPGRWNIYAAIRDELVAHGMPAEEIAFIHSARSDAERAELFAKARDGRIKVLIGSTHKMGTGANIQQRAASLMHVDVPWRPSDLEQREGRILRQGNQNVDYGEVEILSFVSEGTFDAFSWDTVARKARTIAQVKQGGTDRHIEADDADTMSYDEIAAVSSGNPLIKERFQLQADLGRLERLERAHHQSLRDNKHATLQAEAVLAIKQSDLSTLQNLSQHVQNTAGDRFRMAISGTTYLERTDAGKALVDLAGGLIPKSGRLPDLNREIGALGGLRLHIQAQRGDEVIRFAFPEVTLRDKHTLGTTAASATLADLYASDRPGRGTVLRLENYLASIDTTIDKLATEITRGTVRINQLKELDDDAFPHADELTAMRTRMRWLNKKLAAATAPVAAVAEPAPSWLSKHPDPEALIWGNQLHRLVPGGASQADDIRAGDVLTSKDGLQLVRSVIADRMTTIYFVPLSGGTDHAAPKERRHREATTVGVVGRMRTELDDFEIAITASPAGDPVVTLSDIEEGDQVTISGWAIENPTRALHRYATSLHTGLVTTPPDLVTVGGITLNKLTLEINGVPTVVHARSTDDRAIKHHQQSQQPPENVPAASTDAPATMQAVDTGPVVTHREPDLTPAAAPSAERVPPAQGSPAVMGEPSGVQPDPVQPPPLGTISVQDLYAATRTPITTETAGNCRQNTFWTLPGASPTPDGFVAAARLTVTHDPQLKQYTAELSETSISPGGYFAERYNLTGRRTRTTVAIEPGNRFSAKRFDEFVRQVRNILVAESAPGTNPQAAALTTPTPMAPAVIDTPVLPSNGDLQMTRPTEPDRSESQPPGDDGSSYELTPDPDYTPPAWIRTPSYSSPDMSPPPSLAESQAIGPELTAESAAEDYADLGGQNDYGGLARGILAGTWRDLFTPGPGVQYDQHEQLLASRIGGDDPMLLAAYLDAITAALPPGVTWDTISGNVFTEIPSTTVDFGQIREAIQAIPIPTIETVDPYVVVNNPDDFFGPPLYEGPVSEANRMLEPGNYAAQIGSPDDAAARLLTVTESRAFLPTAEPVKPSTEQRPSAILDRHGAIIPNIDAFDETIDYPAGSLPLPGFPNIPSTSQHLQELNQASNTRLPDQIASTPAVLDRSGAIVPGSPQAGPVINHGAAGSTITGTTRDNTQLRAVAKEHGFKWSARQQFWYLPRNWKESTRDRAVANFQGAMARAGQDIPVRAHQETKPAYPSTTAPTNGLGRNTGIGQAPTNMGRTTFPFEQHTSPTISRQL